MRLTDTRTELQERQPVFTMKLADMDASGSNVVSEVVDVMPSLDLT